ncbi:MAG: DoxX-like family protein [Blastocatellia bacterium]
MALPIQDVLLEFPPLLLLRGAVAMVWLYEGLWCKILGQAPLQRQVVESVPKLGPLIGGAFLKLLGVVETLLAVWVMSGVTPGVCAIAQTALLVALNTNGLLWARHIIHDPAGMVVKNIAFLALAWVCGAMPGVRW